MAKLIALALAFAALVAFASAQSTIVTTTIEEVDPFSRQQCTQQVQGERLNQCQRYIQQGGRQSSYGQDSRSQQQQGDVQSCCQELQRVDQQCQCEAVKEAFRQAQRQQQQQQQQQRGSFGSQQIQQMKQKAQNLPDQCNLRERQCQIGAISVTTTTTFTEENTRGSQQCQNVRGRRFNQCQNFIQRQISGGSYPLLMSISRQGQETQGIEQCCNELQNVERECQCDAIQEVYRQAQQQQQQQQQQQGSRRGGQPQTRDLQQIVQDLRNQCNLQVQQCRIPSAMF